MLPLRNLPLLLFISQMTYKLCTYFLLHKHYKIFLLSDSAVAILPVSVRLIEKPVNRKFSVNRLTVNIPGI